MDGILQIAARAIPFTNGFNMSYGTAYLLCIAAFIFALFCSFNVKHTFAKYNKVSSRRSLPAYEVARQILDNNGLYDVSIVHVSGNLTDHYDPKTRVVALSDSVYSNTTLGAIGVAAHESGHAIQHNTNYLPIKIRSAIFPIANIGSFAYVWVFLIGLVMNNDLLVNIGIILFAFVVLFQLVTLPVEFNASGRAMKTLKTELILEDDELKGARKTLTAAAMTYVASLLVSITQLLRLLARANRRR